MNTYRLSAKALLASVGFAALACGMSPAAADTPEQLYRKERADCLSGRNPQDLHTCLREAAAELVEARRPHPMAPSPSVLASNALQRCQLQPPDERADCERLMEGEGTQEGSVAQGAIVREMVTIQMDPTAAGRPAVAASAASR